MGLLVQHSRAVGLGDLQHKSVTITNNLYHLSKNQLFAPGFLIRRHVDMPLLMLEWERWQVWSCRSEETASHLGGNGFQLSWNEILPSRVLLGNRSSQHVSEAPSHIILKTSMNILTLSEHVTILSKVIYGIWMIMELLWGFVVIPWFLEGEGKKKPIFSLWKTENGYS